MARGASPAADPSPLLAAARDRCGSPRNRQPERRADEGGVEAAYLRGFAGGDALEQGVRVTQD